MTLGSFGDAIFEVSNKKIMTFDNLKRQTKHRFSVHELINNVSKLESVGVAPDEIQFEVTLHAGLGVDPQKESQKLRAYCHKGEAHYLILGNFVIGKQYYVLESVDEDFVQYPAVLKLQLKFKEYA